MILRGLDVAHRWRWSPFFAPSEFECAHCHEPQIETEFMDRLYAIRLEYGRPMRITSGYRCSIHNARVSSTGAHGPHTIGAADIGVFGRDAWDLVALSLGPMSGVGIKQHGTAGARFVHLDALEHTSSHPRPRVWSYQ